jgi:hypothetical protein
MIGKPGVKTVIFGRVNGNLKSDTPGELVSPGDCSINGRATVSPLSTEIVSLGTVKFISKKTDSKGIRRV